MNVELVAVAEMSRHKSRDKAKADASTEQNVIEERDGGRYRERPYDNAWEGKWDGGRGGNDIDGR